MTPGARIQAAIELLAAVEAEGRPADRAVFDYLRGRRYIGSKDRRAITDLVYAVLRARARLDWWIARAAADPPEDEGEEGGSLVVPRRRVIAWLLLGEARPLAEVEGLFSGARFAPAPLDEAERRLAKRLAGHTLAHPQQPAAVRLELPEWLLVRLQAALGPRAEAELSALLGEASLDLRVNALKADRETARRALAAEGIEAAPGRWSPLALTLDGRRPVAASRAFRDGLVEVQDEGSQLVALLTDARPGQRVCDFCAGAGGKALALAAAMGNKGQIVACDTLAGRLERSATRLRRAGAHNVTRRSLADERDPWVKRHKARFDRVLVDAPCSGSGTWRRNPDARWRLAPESLEALVALQARILDSAARLVAPGGRLVYATCSLLAEENEGQVARFLAGHPDFALLPVAAVWAEVLGGAPPGDGPYLDLTPAAQGTDGFFAAVLQRREAETTG